MQTYTFVLDQPRHQDIARPAFVVAEGDTAELAEIRARDHLREIIKTVHGFRRTLIFKGVPLTSPDIDGGAWIDARD
ncbi:hypothetical protein [Streptomyces sp. NPDC057253]|uniref:hypothetical protein n=1 Tax=Streptomyces sp. NPDC057253 TaxID=3346069 RepID=UPI00363AB455